MAPGHVTEEIRHPNGIRLVHKRHFPRMKRVSSNAKCKRQQKRKQAQRRADHGAYRGLLFRLPILLPLPGPPIAEFHGSQHQKQRAGKDAP